MDNLESTVLKSMLRVVRKTLITSAVGESSDDLSDPGNQEWGWGLSDLIVKHIP
jgi:hypothetical protein